MSDHKILDEVRFQIRKLYEKVKHDMDPEPLARLQCTEQWVQPVFDYELEECEFGTDERFGSFVYGWPWSSAEKPLSVDDQWTLCQLDLDEIRQISGRDFGTGLLQLTIGEIPLAHEGSGLNMQYIEATDIPFISDWTIVPRSEIERSMAAPFPYRSECPFDVLSEYMWDEGGEDLPRFHELDDAERKATGMDPWQFEMIVAMRMAENGFEGTATEWAPARRICGWHDITEEAYEELVDAEEEYFLDMVRGCRTDLGQTRRLFAWPNRFPRHWPVRAKPFFCFDAWWYQDTDHEWEILFEEKKSTSKASSNITYHGFRFREIGSYALRRSF